MEQTKRGINIHSLTEKHLLGVLELDSALIRTHCNADLGNSSLTGPASRTNPFQKHYESVK